MKFFRISTVLAVLGAVISGAFLFWTSQSVQQAENELLALQKATLHEEKTIRVLAAEWSYLNRPDRIEALAQDYLRLDLPAAGQVSSDPAQLPDIFVPVVPPEKPPYAVAPASYPAAGVPAAKGGR